MLVESQVAHKTFLELNSKTALQHPPKQFEGLVLKRNKTKQNIRMALQTAWYNPVLWKPRKISNLLKIIFTPSGNEFGTMGFQRVGSHEVNFMGPLF